MWGKVVDWKTLQKRILWKTIYVKSCTEKKKNLSLSGKRSSSLKFTDLKGAQLPSRRRVGESSKIVRKSCKEDMGGKTSSPKTTPVVQKGTILSGGKKGGEMSLPSKRRGGGNLGQKLLGGGPPKKKDQGGGAKGRLRGL